MIDEVWKEIKGFPDYQVSNLGRIKSLKYDRERILKNSLTPKGYFAVNLYNNTRNFRFVHVLVLEAFVGLCPIGYQTGHLDNDKTNDRLDNLAWVSQSENQRMGYQIFESDSGAKLTLNDAREIRRLYATGDYTYENLAKMYSVSFQHIGLIIQEKTWKELSSHY